MKFYGELLTASEEGRVLEYNLLTFGERGRTNMGAVTVDSGALQIPAGQMPVNDEHHPGVPVGYMTTAERDGRLIASVHYFDTPEGEAAFSDAKSGKRRGISMEVLKPLVRAGKLLAGLLCGAGIVKSPAFPSSLMLAADFGEDPQGAEQPNPESPEALAEAAAVELDAEALQKLIEEAIQKALNPEEPKAKEDPEVPQKLEASAVPASLEQFIQSVVAKGKPEAKQEQQQEQKLYASAPKTLTEFCDTLRAVKSGTLGSKLTAAMATVTQEDVLDPAAQPQWLGEVWNDTEYFERYADLVTQVDLTSLTVKGWEWVEGMTPIADDWDPYEQGDYDADPLVPSTMNQIPSTEIQAVGREWTAKRIAGGNKFDRAVLDFPVPGQMESYIREQAEYIKIRRDARVRAHLIAAAKIITGTGNDVANPWRKIILGSQHVMETTTPTFAIVGNDIYRELLGSDMLENLALLETSLGLKEGSMSGFKIRPAAITDVALNGRVFVGSSKKVVLHQTGGGAPIRVDAQELANGSVDKAVFAYYMLRSDLKDHTLAPNQTTNPIKNGLFEVKQ
jgi:hypothetical protein